ncbi:hypothetical protein N7510_001212 [Penicillium lagena]|uniref:uncharacterized protein n=1 Tax=Penicillium lagena TaxID=94218 RepID=UPI002541DAA0|nr:uncharacterized protein N7510_001212 [Penicillium lagena]KAJ5624903.1 hypothetical protein N7510_001212 [Penicillium lagena]
MIQKDDLVLLWRTELENESAQPQEIVHPEELNTGLTLGKYHLDLLKPFVSRSEDGLEEAQRLARRTSEQHAEIEAIMKEYRKTKWDRQTGKDLKLLWAVSTGNDKGQDRTRAGDDW